MSSSRKPRSVCIPRWQQQLQHAPTASERVSSSTNDLYHLLDALPMMIVALSPQGAITFWNHACETISGHLRAELLGQPQRLTKISPDLAAFRKSGHSISRVIPCALITRTGERRLIAWAELPSGELFPRPETWLLGCDVTEHLTTSTALEQEQDHTRRLIQTVGALVIELDTQGHIILFNPACEAATGFREEEVIGRAIWDVLIPEHQEKEVRAVFGELLQTDATNQFENVILTKDGRERLISWHNTSLRDPHGTVLSVVGTGIDVTEQRQVVEALRRSEAHYRALFESITDVVFVLDHEWRYVVVNRAMGQFTAKNRAEIIGQRITDIFPDFEETDQFKVFQRVMQGRRPWQITSSFAVPDGPPGAFEFRVFPVPDGILCIARDVTERKQLEDRLQDYAVHLQELVDERTAQLQAEKEQTEAILNSVADGVLLTDLKGAILHANPVAQQWLSEIEPPEDRERLRDTLRMLATSHQAGEELLIELTNLDLQARTASMPNTGQNAGVVIALHNVTRLKEVDRLKTKFVSNVSHELRTPLTSLKLYLTLLRRGSDEKREHYMDVLEDQATTLERLVENLLDLSRLDRGIVPFAPDVVDLNKPVCEVVHLYTTMVYDHNLSLAVHLSPEPVLVYADAQQLAQVTTNLLSNAINYTQPGGQITITTEQDADQAILRVQDTGIGIPPDDLPNLFERFFRAENTRISQVAGSGLGLAIVKELLDLHHGTIEVESYLEKGTTFTVRLPLTKPSV